MENEYPAQEKSYQLAKYYAKRLKSASLAYRRGHENTAFALASFDQDWPQIKRWWQWVNDNAQANNTFGQLCILYSFYGEEIFLFRLPPHERFEWVQNALTIARQTHHQIAEINCLRRMAWALQKQGRLDESETITRQALSLAESIGDFLSIGRILYLLAEILTAQGDLTESWNLASRSLEVLLSINAEMYLPDAYRAIGNVLYLKGEFEKALEYGLQSVVILETKGLEASFMYNFLGAIACDAGDYVLAEDYLLRSQSNTRQHGNQSQLAQSLLLLGYLECCRQAYPTAEKYLNESFQLALSINEGWLIPLLEVEQGYLLGQIGQHDLAQQKLNRSLEYAYKHSHSGVLIRALLYLAETYIETNNLLDAQTALNEGLKMAYENNRTIEIMYGIFVAARLDYFYGELEGCARMLGLLSNQMGVVSYLIRLGLNLYTELENLVNPSELTLWFEDGKSLDYAGVVEGILNASNPLPPESYRQQ